MAVKTARLLKQQLPPPTFAKFHFSQHFLILDR
jgi:hypothetical protein